MIWLANWWLGLVGWQAVPKKVLAGYWKCADACDHARFTGNSDASIRAGCIRASVALEATGELTPLLGADLPAVSEKRFSGDEGDAPLA